MPGYDSDTEQERLHEEMLAPITYKNGITNGTNSPAPGVVPGTICSAGTSVYKSGLAESPAAPFQTQPFQTRPILTGAVLTKLALTSLLLVVFLVVSGCGSSSSNPLPGPASGEEPDPVETDPPNDNNPPDDANGSGAFTVSTESEASLIEGSNGISLAVGVTRTGGHNDSIELELLASNNADAENLVAYFDNPVLESPNNNTRLNLELRIGMGPILIEQRQLIIRATDSEGSKDIPLKLNVEPVDAPDIYLLIGQSNMQGSSEFNAKNIGENGEDQPHPRIRQLNVTGNNFDNFQSPRDYTNPDNNVGTPRFIVAEDPLHEESDPANANKRGTQIGIGLSFAKAALPHTTRNIVLVPAAWSGTAFCENAQGNLAWNPRASNNPVLGGTSLFDRAVVRANIAIDETGGILRGILWHQGESDATTDACASVYQENLQLLISTLRNNIQPDRRGTRARGSDGAVPFILGTMSRGNDQNGDYYQFDAPKTKVDSVHRSITTGPDPRVSFGAFVDNDDLVPAAWPCGEGSCVHFGSSALREMGRRYYQKLREILANQ